MTRLLKKNVPVVTYELLKFNKIPVTKSYLRERLQSHLDYPSLVSISDVLKRYKAEHIFLHTIAAGLYKR
jgi:hypothetical protein